MAFVATNPSIFDELHLHGLPEALTVLNDQTLVIAEALLLASLCKTFIAEKEVVNDAGLICAHPLGRLSDRRLAHALLEGNVTSTDAITTSPREPANRDSNNSDQRTP